jgi:hypothetical protein
MSEPSMISASTRFLAQPSEIMPTRNRPAPGGFVPAGGFSLEFIFVTVGGG